MSVRCAKVRQRVAEFATNDTSRMPPLLMNDCIANRAMLSIASIETSSIYVRNAEAHCMMLVTFVCASLCGMQTDGRLRIGTLRGSGHVYATCTRIRRELDFLPGRTSSSQESRASVATDETPDATTTAVLPSDSNMHNGGHYAGRSGSAGWRSAVGCAWPCRQHRCERAFGRFMSICPHRGAFGGLT